ncbi:MAG: hypothetical protein ABR985_05385 [Methanotrichaceae archaeon]|jgi:hypothetical protein
MANENVATMKADAKKIMSDLGNVMSHAKADAEKAVSDLGNILSHAKADANADVEKLKAKFLGMMMS